MATTRGKSSLEAINQAPVRQSGMAALGLASLGVVFGDIGTSPLYTLKTVVALAGGKADPDVVLGSLSLIIWTLTIITTIKYVMVAMQINNEGEGGILALMSLIGIKRHRRPMIIAAGLFGAALIYGDGAITPAISVLSAVEGLERAAPAVVPYILPLTIGILVALFLIQPLGTARIGRAFGPIMLCWFVVIGVLGLISMLRHPSVIAAINPMYAIHFLAMSGATGFLVLGGVFLCVTGAEALYADMGHFGAFPIRLAWLGIVFPSLFFSYAGQCAYVLENGASADNIFFRLCPDSLLLPLVILATLATIIASQSIISGAFSMTRQAIRLGWMPRMFVTQTSEEGYGQIYVGVVNWLLMLVTIGLVLAFRKSDNLASAYGIAVSATMLMTSVLLFIAMREVLQWSLIKAAIVAGVFLTVDTMFFAANLVKIADGGYVPLILAASVYAVMYIWHLGQTAIRDRLRGREIPLATFLAGLPAAGVSRVRGSAVFLTRVKTETPPVISWYVDHSHALQERVVALTIETQLTPWVDDANRATLTLEGPNFWRVNARYGFLERPDVVQLLDDLKKRGCGVDLADVTYYVAVETVVSREDGGGLPKWLVAVFAYLHRNAMHLSDAFNFPRDRLIEIGRQVAI
ncbi:KUP/HAK/KT family potassium transporter [Hyphomicrobium sp.]|uniref:potassium transporter Kup n=1 Tax=Hyphomicrobium sp. TaxID=82 RepID=UPI0025B84848|nr:KUP/HAK/KT family potassium transporter [Hyphomicrobium sp.]